MIKLESITKKYNSTTVIENFSLHIKKGEKLLLMGQSGGGKTTLLNIASGLVLPDGGNVICNGNIAYMFQEPRLLPSFNVKDNILSVLKKEQKSIAEKYISIVGISDFCEKFPHELSGGMAQRAAYARFLAYAEATGADILLLDEPFSALDGELSEKMCNILSEFSKNKALLLVTHSQKDADIIGGKIIHI